MKTIICVDVETGGLDCTTCPMIEIACVLYSVEHRCTIESYASLLRADTNDAEGINRIPVAALRVARDAVYAWTRINEMVCHAQSLGPSCWMAHRADFDRGFIATRSPSLAAALPWVCSKFDCEWPLSKIGESCVGMALAHGVPVVSAHRALTDAMLIARTLERVQELGHDLPAILAKAMRPKALFRVADTNFDEARNTQAKAAGFRWEKPYWVRSLAIADASTMPFAVVQVSP